MEQDSHGTLPRAYDTAACARIWRRVSPQLDPYPESHTQSDTAGNGDGALALPGAQEDPCCLGTQALTSLDVLQGFLREEVAVARTYLAFARCAINGEARRVLRSIAAEETEHARQLQAVSFLITGKSYRVEICTPKFSMNGYCAALRARYHEEVCGGFNYERAAEETTDFCLKKLFSQLSADEYRHAELLRKLLAKALPY